MFVWTTHKGREENLGRRQRRQSTALFSPLTDRCFINPTRNEARVWPFTLCLYPCLCGSREAVTVRERGCAFPSGGCGGPRLLGVASGEQVEVTPRLQQMIDESRPPG